MDSVTKERTGFRDLALSQRHRQWGYDCPAVDIDFLLVEYDGGIPVAIVEYKHQRARAPAITDANSRALIELGRRADIPVFCCKYRNDPYVFMPTPWTCKAYNALRGRFRFSEIEWVSFLYELRGRKLPCGLFDVDGNLQ